MCRNTLKSVLLNLNRRVEDQSKNLTIYLFEGVSVEKQDSNIDYHIRGACEDFLRCILIHTISLYEWPRGK